MRKILFCISCLVVNVIAFAQYNNLLNFAVAAKGNGSTGSFIYNEIFCLLNCKRM